MSTKSKAILEEIRALPPDEQAQLVAEAIRLRDDAQEWARQKGKLREMQSRHSGRGLGNRLLAERAKERARG